MATKQAIYCEIVLLLFARLSAKEIGLPMIQINHDENDEYPDLQEEVQLNDFFWTGSGDGPPEYVKKIHAGINAGKNMIVKTNTVIATVYADEHKEIDVPICLDCFPDNTINYPLNFSSTDRRYWLLTVVSGFYLAKDIPMFERKLAQLYRLAFTRQQSEHLGIGNRRHPSTASVSLQRTQKDTQVNLIDISLSNNKADQVVMNPIITEKRKRRQTHENGSHDKWLSSTSIPYPFEVEYVDFNKNDNNPQEILEVSQNPTNDQEHSKQTSSLHILPNEPLVAIGSSQDMIPETLYTDDNVRIVIHNLTRITGEDYQNTVQSTGLSDEHRLRNQTELVYSVFVNGRPVLATTAANDMKLVSDTEVAAVMRNEVVMKAEPYLREPQATPLAPATRSSSPGIITSLQDNALLLIIGSIVILLLILLLISLFLTGRSNGSTMTEAKRISSRNELLSSSTPIHQMPQKILTLGPMPHTRQTTHSHAYENEPSRSQKDRRRRKSSSSSDNTSDSSVYCPINPPPQDVQEILDKKAATLFDKRKLYQHQYDKPPHEDAAYATVVSEKSKETKTRYKNKAKRRYLSENRVGSVEEVPHNSSTETTASNESIAEALHSSREEIGHAEAYNPHSHYSKDRLHKSRVFTNKVNGSVQDDLLLRNIKGTTQSYDKSETGSIGSFLSMASVKSFPKQSLPEPLNRVLEPVFVTYYDNVNEPIQKPPREQRSHHRHREVTTTLTLPEPQQPKSSMLASLSDNPDPGVIGPIVWEIHKKRMALNNADDQNCSPTQLVPIQDPANARSHYQDLLEGAIQMYSSQDDLPKPLPTKNFHNHHGQSSREHRGKSAGYLDHSRPNTGARPSTAQPEKTSHNNKSPRPPSPNIGAWGSGGIQQPLVRPLSAGPFHRPEQLSNLCPTTTSSHLPTQCEPSAAPLIQAIKEELKKFKRDI